MNIRWILCAALLTTIVFILWQRPDTSDPGPRALTASWQSVFLNRDGATAYALFLKKGATMPSEDSHTLSHVIGSVLYDRYGLEGLRYCTRDFNYGCYHGFAGRVIEVQGITGIEPLLAACEGHDPMSCQHGIGHGIMAYMGNDRLNDALTYCPADDSGPCTNGVFMEYFVNTMRRAVNRDILAFDPRDPTGPCAVVTDERYKGACYYGLPKLWRAWISRTTPDTAEQFAFVGQLCEQVRDPDLSTLCFEGNGALAVPFGNYDEQEAMLLCAAMPEDGRDACKAEAINALHTMSSRLGV